MERLRIVSDFINANYSDYTLLDVGCRTRNLAPLLLGCRKYVGTDIEFGEDIEACNLEEKLPFNNSSFDIVCALDVLEHLNNIHSAVDEIKRIASKLIIISLPNMAHWSFRLNFLLSGVLSGKYKFHPYPVIDRHRWVTNFIESREFMNINFDAGMICIDILPKRGRTRYITSPLEKFLAKHFPNIFCYGTVFIISKTPSL